MTHVDEIVKGIYRLSSPPDAQFPIGFNQFLIDDEKPALVHTGYYESYDAIRSAVAEVLDPKRLAYVIIGHFESDECGGMDRFLADAPASVLVASELGAKVNLIHWGYKGVVKGMRDGDALELGSRRLRFLETPHVHHWDSMMIFEETSQSLFPADLFIQPGDQPALIKEDLTLAMLGLYRGAGIFAHESPVRQAVDRIEKLSPKWFHPMHGGSFESELAPSFYRALRNEPFGYTNVVLGRSIGLPDSGFG
ncbi:MAG TPA: MBL fold metallo-hydrolase [Chthoniobacterales bacterium]|nr:MBL fold metallo-hydrolase [Chthoniobacterales bacterium]